MEKKTLGSFLSALRRAKGLTQQEVADRLAVILCVELLRRHLQKKKS